MAMDTKSESETVECSGEMWCGVYENSRVVDLLFGPEFAQKQYGELCGLGQKQPYVEEFVRSEIDGRVQPVAFAVT